MDWVWDGNLCNFLFYEHRAAVLMVFACICLSNDGKTVGMVHLDWRSRPVVDLSEGWKVHSFLFWGCQGGKAREERSDAIRSCWKSDEKERWSDEAWELTLCPALYLRSMTPMPSRGKVVMFPNPLAFGSPKSGGDPVWGKDYFLKRVIWSQKISVGSE